MRRDTQEAVLRILASAATPLTTGQIKGELDRGSAVGDIYALLLLLQSTGQISCTVSSPWKWTKVTRSSDFGGYRHEFAEVQESCAV